MDDAATAALEKQIKALRREISALTKAMDRSRWKTTAEAAKLTGVEESTLKKWHRKREIPEIFGKMRSRKIYVDMNAFWASVENNRNAAIVAEAKKARAKTLDREKCVEVYA